MLHSRSPGKRDLACGRSLITSRRGSIRNRRWRSGLPPQRSEPRERLRSLRLLHAGSAVAAPLTPAVVDLETTSPKGRDRIFTNISAGHRPACWKLDSEDDFSAQKSGARISYHRIGAPAFWSA